MSAPKLRRGQGAGRPLPGERRRASAWASPREWGSQARPLEGGAQAAPQNRTPSPEPVWTPRVSARVTPGVRVLSPPPEPGVTRLVTSAWFQIPHVQSGVLWGPPETVVRIGGRQFRALGNWWGVCARAGPRDGDQP